MSAGTNVTCRLSRWARYQHFRLFPHPTTIDNLTEAPAHVLRWPKPELQGCGMKPLAQVGLWGHLASLARPRSIRQPRLTW